MAQLMQTARSHQRLLVGFALLILVVLLWVPWGLNVGFTGDDWIWFHQVDKGTIMSHASPTRLFIPIPWILAFNMSPGYFAGINLFLGLMIFGKGGLIYAILR